MYVEEKSDDDILLSHEDAFPMHENSRFKDTIYERSETEEDDENSEGDQIIMTGKRDDYEFAITRQSNVIPSFSPDHFDIIFFCSSEEEKFNNVRDQKMIHWQKEADEQFSLRLDSRKMIDRQKLMTTSSSIFSECLSGNKTDRSWPREM